MSVDDLLKSLELLKLSGGINSGVSLSKKHNKWKCCIEAVYPFLACGNRYIPIRVRAEIVDMMKVLAPDMDQEPLDMLNLPTPKLNHVSMWHRTMVKTELDKYRCGEKEYPSSPPPAPRSLEELEECDSWPSFEHKEDLIDQAGSSKIRSDVTHFLRKSIAGEAMVDYNRTLEKPIIVFLSDSARVNRLKQKLQEVRVKNEDSLAPLDVMEILTGHLPKFERTEGISSGYLLDHYGESNDDDDDDSFEPSRLGTKEHWDHVYHLECRNFRDFKDPGEIWFGEDCVTKLVHHIQSLPTVALVSSRIVDIGCGNGYTLFRLADAGFQSLVGVDYSENAIELSHSIAQTDKLAGINISFLVDDFLHSSLPSGAFDVVIDKGTFDALALSVPADLNKQLYCENIARICAASAFFVITSCNFTRDELLAYFENEFGYFSFIDYPTIKFGGVEGKTHTTLTFRKK